MSYKIEDIQAKKGSFQTVDGKYFTKADSKGYSYWYDDTDYEVPGHHGYDYCFYVPKHLHAKEQALILLNKLINENEIIKNR